MRTLLVLLLSFGVLTACVDRALNALREDLQNTVIEYNDLLRWGEFNKAKLYTDSSIREKFGASAKAAKNVKIVDYRVLSTDFEVEKGEQIVEVELDYYTFQTNVVKTSLDKQRWSFVYVKEEKKKRWRLMTPLPEFK
jgi:hypothetical protein